MYLLAAVFPCTPFVLPPFQFNGNFLFYFLFYLFFFFLIGWKNSTSVFSKWVNDWSWKGRESERKREKAREVDIEGKKKTCWPSYGCSLTVVLFSSSILPLFPYPCCIMRPGCFVEVMACATMSHAFLLAAAFASTAAGERNCISAAPLRYANRVHAKHDSGNVFRMREF